MIALESSLFMIVLQSFFLERGMLIKNIETNSRSLYWIFPQKVLKQGLVYLSFEIQIRLIL